MAKVYIDAINSHWETTPEENVIIHEVTSAREKAFFHSPSYRRGAWDGFIRMYNPRTKQLPSGLVADAGAALEAAGYPVEYTEAEVRDFDARPEAEINFEITAEHQLRAVEAMCSTRRGIIHAATNSGKTKIAEAWCAMHDCAVLYLVPSKELLSQTVKSFRQDTNLRIGYISADQEWEYEDCDVVVCLVSSVGKRKSKKTGKVINQKAVDRFKLVAKRFEAIIVDECHHMTAETWRWVMRTATNAYYRYGLSGTPWEHGDDATALRVKSLLGPVIATVSNAELIEKGWSARPIVKMIPVHSQPIEIEVPESEEGDGMAIYGPVYEQGIVYNDLRNNMIAKLCEDLISEDKICLVIALRLDQIEILTELMKIKRITHRVITGGSDREERKSDLTDFRNREFSVLISNVLSEGVDIPSLNAVLFASGGKSSKQILQRIGRGIRKKTDGKNEVEIFDFRDTNHEILKRQTTARIKLYEREGFEVQETDVRF